MPHHVYANNNEIASQSADGKSTAAAPDVCFTTPMNVAAGTPVPFSNTCKAKDLKKTSKTVSIKGGGIALENKSFFKKSYGDEGATNAHKKGIISGKITGKCYFQSWSPNVKVEGLAVARHMDTVTHNHANPANALVQKYKSEFNKNTTCKGDKEEIAKKCKPKKDAKKKKVQSKKKGLLKTLGNIATLPDKAARKAYGFKRKKDNQWVDDHCDGLWVKPMSGEEGKAQFEEAKKQINEILEIAQDPMKIVQHAADQIWDMAKEHLSSWFLIKQGLKFGGKALVKNVIGGAAATTGVGVVVTAAMAASTINDAIQLGTAIAEKLGPEALQHVDDLVNMDKLKEKAAKLAEDYKNEPEKMMADAQSALARTNACVKARRCQLVPYNKTSAKDAAKNGDGCCPGQSGHHIMPDSMMEGNDCYGKNPATGKGVSARTAHGNAPTMCLEGATNRHGSHGKAHSKLLKSMALYRKENKTEVISYSEAKKQALDSVCEPKPGAPAAGCDRRCLEAQLDAYYKACQNEQELPAVAGVDDTKLPTFPDTTKKSGGDFD